MLRQRIITLVNNIARCFSPRDIELINKAVIELPDQQINNFFHFVRAVAIWNSQTKWTKYYITSNFTVGVSNPYWNRPYSVAVAIHDQSILRTNVTFEVIDQRSTTHRLTFVSTTSDELVEVDRRRFDRSKLAQRNNINTVNELIKHNILPKIFIQCLQ